MTRTYWLSFCDNDRPKGQQFLGAVVVDVAEDEAVAAAMLYAITHEQPMHDQDEGPWIGAAIRLAWAAGVNPGGEVTSVRIDQAPAFERMSPMYQRLQLLSRAECEEIDRKAAEVAP